MEPKPHIKLKKVPKEERGKVSIGDFQFNKTNEERLSGQNIKTLVCSKGGLEVEEVCAKFKDMIKEDPDELIIQVGVSNCKREEVEDIQNKFE